MRSRKRKANTSSKIRLAKVSGPTNKRNRHSIVELREESMASNQGASDDPSIHDMSSTINTGTVKITVQFIEPPKTPENRARFQQRQASFDRERRMNSSIEQRPVNVGAGFGEGGRGTKYYPRKPDPNRSR